MVYFCSQLLTNASQHQQKPQPDRPQTSKWCLLQCASMEDQLTSSTQEISQLRAQVSTLESELAAHASSTSDSSSPAAHVAELISLRAELQQKELEISELHLQLQAAVNTSAEVGCQSCCMTSGAVITIGRLYSVPTYRRCDATCVCVVRQAFTRSFNCCGRDDSMVLRQTCVQGHLSSDLQSG